MHAGLALLQKHLVRAIPAALLLGLAFGALVDAGFLRAAILPLTLLMVYPMMVPLKLGALARRGDGRLQGVALALNFGLLPLLGWGLGQAFFAGQPALQLALLLTALLPTSGMTISWTGMARGNLPAAVKMTVLGLVLGSLLAPLYLKALLGAVVEVPVAGVALQIALIVFLPMALGWATQRWLVARHGAEAFEAQWKPRFAPWSTLGVLGMVFVSMALKAPDILRAPGSLLTLLPPLLLLYALNFAVAAVLGRWLFARADAVALLYGTVMRNLSIALAIALGVFGAQGAEAGLLIALAYVVQVQGAAWSVRLADRVFGPAAPGPVTAPATPRPAAPGR
jgi:ACR3 family arsenite efflux pump ArsB